MLLVNWGACLALSAVVYFLTKNQFLDTFVKTFAICCGAVVFAFLMKKDIMSMLLMAGGAVILFAVTVTAQSMLLG